uniref:Phosphate transport system permease protein PstA n=1 Tax=Desulfobacca acetoxidans TaxID=60893 RepID=A0A7V6DQ19_9BACT
MRPRPVAPRKVINILVSIGAWASALLGIFVLFWILAELLIRGLGALSWDIFFKLPTPPGVSGGGLANAILGTLILTATATVLAVPLGLLAGIYLAEYAANAKLADYCRFSANVLMGMPSIIVGVFAYTLVVVPLGKFCGYAGTLALAILMLPIVTRITEDMLRLVPNTLREAALALGLPRWRVTLAVIFRAAKAGLITGILLAVARVSGETAPLLFTALNSPYWFSGLGEPFPNLPVTIFNYAMSPYADWQEKAWAGALLITAGVLVISILSRTYLSGKNR